MESLVFEHTWVVLTLSGVVFLFLYWYAKRGKILFHGDMTSRSLIVFSKHPEAKISIIKRIGDFSILVLLVFAIGSPKVHFPGRSREILIYLRKEVIIDQNLVPRFQAGICSFTKKIKKGKFGFIMDHLPISVRWLESCEPQHLDFIRLYALERSKENIRPSIEEIVQKSINSMDNWGSHRFLIIISDKDIPVGDIQLIKSLARKKKLTIFPIQIGGNHWNEGLKKSLTIKGIGQHTQTTLIINNLLSTIAKEINNYSLDIYQLFVLISLFYFLARVLHVTEIETNILRNHLIKNMLLRKVEISRQQLI